MTTITTDADLVAAHLGGDRGALAGIYDRYADSLYDTAAAMLRDRQEAADVAQDVFVIAAERLDQLRDPDRLKPWLFAVLRNEVYRRTGMRRRSVATDFTDAAAEMYLPPDQPDATEAIAHEELAVLVRDAASGLDPRDQLVLEYSVRQGLEGEELAQALGVSSQQSYSMLHRMRQRAERSLGALCVAKAGRRECAELDAILRDWDGQFSVLIRKRVARHIDNCDICERSRRKLAPIALFAAAPALQAPAELRSRVLAATEQGGPGTRYGFDAPGGFPSALGQARRIAMWFGIVALAMFAAVAVTVWVLADDEPDVLATADVQSAPPTVPEVTAADAGAEAPQPPTGGDGDAGGEEVASAPPIASPDTSEPSATTPASTEPSATTPASTEPAATAPESTEAPGATSTTDAPAGATTTTLVEVGPPPTVPPTTPTTVPPSTTPTTTIPPTTTTLPPGSLTLSAGDIDFGTTTDVVTVTLTNDGGLPVDWSASFGPSGFRKVSGAFAVQPASGTLAAGASAKVTVAIDRTWSTEGPLTSSLLFAAKDTDAALSIAGEIARAPQIDAAQTPVQICAFDPAGARNRLTAVATVLDESSIKVSYAASDQYENNISAEMTERSGAWYASIVVQDLPQDSIWTWTITATDAFGNASTERGRTEIVPTFC